MRRQDDDLGDDNEHALDYGSDHHHSHAAHDDDQDADSADDHH